MNGEVIQLSGSYTGKGSKLFTVSVTGKDWDGMAVHRVAAEDEQGAIDLTLSTYDMEEDAPTEWYAQEIGEFL